MPPIHIPKPLITFQMAATTMILTRTQPRLFPGTFPDAINSTTALRASITPIGNFPVTERVKLQFRAEFFNIFNNVNFNNPTASVNNSGFGTINGAGDPRIGQLAPDKALNQQW